MITAPIYINGLDVFSSNSGVVVCSAPLTHSLRSLKCAGMKSKPLRFVSMVSRQCHARTLETLTASSLHLRQTSKGVTNRGLLLAKALLFEPQANACSSLRERYLEWVLSFELCRPHNNVERQNHSDTQSRAFDVEV